MSQNRQLSSRNFLVKGYITVISVNFVSKKSSTVKKILFAFAKRTAPVLKKNKAEKLRTW